jgi:hypothetical protein
VLGVSPGDHILVPSFHCATAVEPIVQYGAKIKFYKINRDCSPNFYDIQAKIDKKTRAILAIHYFGFPQPIHQFQKLCRNYQLSLIEDCAHVLTGKIDSGVLGSFGDVSIFSWRKFFPVYDGGQLVINNPKLCSDISLESPDLLFHIKVLKNILDKLVDDSSNTPIKTLLRYPRMFDAVRRFFISSDGKPPKALSMNNYRQDFDLSSAHVSMTPLSKYILRNMDILATYEKRRLNATYLLASRLSSLSCQKGSVRWHFPCWLPGGRICTSPSDQKGYLRLHGVGLCITHYR